MDKLEQNSKNKNIIFKYPYIFLATIVIFVMITSSLITSADSSLISLKIKELDSSNKSSGCKTIYAEENKKIELYSFDNGLTWQKSNYSTICNNATVKVIGKDNNDEVIAEGIFKVNDLKDNLPEIIIDFDTEIESLEMSELLKGVTAKDQNNDMTKNIVVEITEENDDFILVSYSVTNSKGNTTTVFRKIIKEITLENSIKFEKSIYSCKEGEKITTKITAASEDNIAAVESFESTDTKIAIIEKHPTLTTKSKNEVAIQITCIKEGTTTLKAKSSKVATTTANITVEKETTNVEEKGIIYFETSNYVCKPNEEISTIITAEAPNYASVKSYKSSNDNIATIEKDPNMTLKCINCEAVKIKCKKAGSVTISATSSTGATSSAELTVEKEEPVIIDQGTIYYDKSSYNCKTGEEISTVITATSKDNTAIVKSYSSNNTNIATVEKDLNNKINCINCEAVKIKCKNSGSVIITAESSTGAKSSASITVKEPDKGVITYDQLSYKCKKGKEISAVITADSLDNTATVKSYKSSNTNIATVEKDPNMTLKCINCVAVKITCKNNGITTLTAESSTGATTTSKVTVEQEDVGTINYKEESYTCDIGQEISTTITAEGPNDKIATIKSYSSSNTNIATIEEDLENDIKCINCIAVKIKCKNSGTVTLNATSSEGATTKVSMTVNDK